MTKPFSGIVGIDLHERSTQLARVNVQRFIESSSDKLKCTDVTVHHQDMVTFDQYPQSKAQTTILFMYEPLWTVPKHQAHNTYLQVLMQAKKLNQRVFIAYCYVGRYNGDALPALALINAELLYRAQYSSLFFGEPNDMYIYKI